VAISQEKPLVQLAAFSMVDDEEKPGFLALHPRLVDPNAAETALQVSRLRGMMGDTVGQYRYADAALYIAAELQNTELAIRACRVCAEVAAAVGEPSAEQQYMAMVAYLENQAS
jgi:hypothetical protein